MALFLGTWIKWIFCKKSRHPSAWPWANTCNSLCLMKYLGYGCSLEMWIFLVVSQSVNGLCEPLKNRTQVPGVSVLLSDFKEGGCCFYIKTNLHLLFKRIKSCTNVEGTHGFKHYGLYSRCIRWLQPVPKAHVSFPLCLWDTLKEKPEKQCSCVCKLFIDVVCDVKKM